MGQLDRTDTKYNVVINQSTHHYIAVSYHRNGTFGKSQWTISVPDEISVFTWGMKNEFKIGNKCWGLFLKDNKPEVVGLLANNEESHIARFVCGISDSTWHGYPADYKRAIGDIPTDEILRIWVGNNYINKSKMLKIQQQKPCSL